MSITSKNLRLAATIVVITAYVVARNRIYHYFPARSLDSWFVRDTWMTIPRLAAFIAIFCVNSGWQTAREDWRVRGCPKAVVFGFVATAIWFFYFSGSAGPEFGLDQIGISGATSAAVGLFEEYAYRGPLLQDLGRQLSVRWSIFLSSFLFTIYHYQAQGVEAWGAIFLTGVTFANLRWRGVSLEWLVLIHSVIDTSYFLFGSRTPAETGIHGAVLNVGLLLCAAVTFPQRSNPAGKNAAMV